MRLSILGGGPGGLYFALLAKKEWPQHEITVIERNRADDTFGFGVVFSDETLAVFSDVDQPSYHAIRRNFAYWDDVEICFGGERFRIGGNGFAGCSRKSLLMLLQARCRELGVELVFETEVDDQELDHLLAHSDLVVAADGINSRVRERWRSDFGATVEEGSNFFCWLGSTREFDAFEYFFRDAAESGQSARPMVAHCYQYQPGHSTWVIEMPESTWRGLGFHQLDDRAGEHVPLLERLFEQELCGHSLIDNRSLWRRFPTVRTERWWLKDPLGVGGAPVVLLGDAKATAHYSVGAGTKLAMEDAIGLVAALRASSLALAQPGSDRDSEQDHRPDRSGGAVLESALARYQALRQDEVGKTQHAALVSAQWFEAMERHWRQEPVQFAFGVMSRSKQITYENLRLRDQRFVDRMQRWYLGRVEGQFAGAVEEVSTSVKPRALRLSPDTPPMFTPFRLRDMVVANRVVVSPMAQYKATDGVPNDWHFQHLASRALGGAGLLFVEMTCTSPTARITPGCTGLWNEEQCAQWTRLVDFVHAESPTKICLQLGHAGRKGSTQLGWQTMDHPLESENWPLVSASPLPYLDGISQRPAELDREEMDGIVEEFVRSARYAERARFDMLELHLAHGYLLASFLSPLTNHRPDQYGGEMARRMRFPLEVVAAVRAAWPAAKPLSARISASDWAAGGLTATDVVTLARALAGAGVDLVDVSTGQTVPHQKPIYGRMYQTPFADLVRHEAGIATMTVGNITSADQVNTILLQGRSDLVALARRHLVHPFFTHHAAAWYGVTEHRWPDPYSSGRAQAFRMAEQEREEALRAKAALRPASHQPALEPEQLADLEALVTGGANR